MSKQLLSRIEKTENFFVIFIEKYRYLSRGCLLFGKKIHALFVKALEI